MELQQAIAAHKKLFTERAGLSDLSVTGELTDENGEERYEEKIQKISFKLVLRSK